MAVLGPQNRLVGYARVSTADQDVQMQVAALRRAGVLDDNMHFETVSGVKKRRPKRDLALMDARSGDVFVVYKLDRLGRSFRELLEIVAGLEDRGVGFRSLTEGFDTTTPAGKFMFHMLGALAEFERGLIAERTRDGVRERMRQGKRMGREPIITDGRKDEIEVHIRSGGSVRELAEEWGVTPNAIYRYFPRKRIAKLRALGKQLRK